MHDVNGTPLKVGDKVMIPGVITELNEGNEDFCNVTVETEYGRRPDGQYDRYSAINTGQLVLMRRAAMILAALLLTCSGAFAETDRFVGPPTPRGILYQDAIGIDLPGGCDCDMWPGGCQCPKVGCRCGHQHGFRGMMMIVFQSGPKAAHCSYEQPSPQPPAKQCCPCCVGGRCICGDVCKCCCGPCRPAGVVSVGIWIGCMPSTRPPAVFVPVPLRPECVRPHRHKRW